MFELPREQALRFFVAYEAHKVEILLNILDVLYICGLLICEYELKLNLFIIRVHFMMSL